MVVKDVYCDQELGSGSDDGTSWINAYRLLSDALDGTNTTFGDTLYVKKNKDLAGGETFTMPSSNPVLDMPRVLGCKRATTATPPAQSDLIPGFRTGQTTPAYDDGDAPTFTTTNSNNNIIFAGNFGVLYGLVFKAAGNINFITTGISRYEECEFRCGNTGNAEKFTLGSTTASNHLRYELVNCKLSAGAGGGSLNADNTVGLFNFNACIFDLTASPQIKLGGGQCTFDSCDFTAQSGALLNNAGGRNPRAIDQFLNCSLHASTALVSGTIGTFFRTELNLTSSATGKTTGQTFQEVDIITNFGNIVLETSRVRTSPAGADDGGTGAWSLAFTPGINFTRDNLPGLVGPRMAVEVVGDGTAQTLTVYIANTGSGDYDDDEVWLVAKSPNESGTADYNFYTTQMDLLATPAPVTDDSSTWGTGADNSQKLQITLSPDYDGIIECWVVFAKNFASSPETLYVDPLPVLS